MLFCSVVCEWLLLFSILLHLSLVDHFNISKSGEITLNKPVSLQESGCFNLVVSAYDGKNAANVRPCEPRHDKTNNVSVCPANSDQPGHLPSLIRIVAVRLMDS